MCIRDRCDGRGHRASGGAVGKKVANKAQALLNVLGGHSNGLAKLINQGCPLREIIYDAVGRTKSSQSVLHNCEQAVSDPNHEGHRPWYKWGDKVQGEAPLFWPDATPRGHFSETRQVAMEADYYRREGNELLSDVNGAPRVDVNGKVSPRLKNLYPDAGVHPILPDQTANEIAAYETLDGAPELHNHLRNLMA